jgi:tRNA pseudouridine38-40 synthase
MHNIKLTLAYDGSEFHGWQLQPGVATIQGALVDVARKITQEKVFIHGASRTDAGVHALGQVAHFKTKSALTAVEFQRAFNALLPPHIRVMQAEEMGPDFHARWQSLAKTYQYRIFRGRVVPPFEYRRVLHYPWPLDEARMMEAARMFEGEHDFTSFAASSGSEEDDRDRNAVREIYQSEIVRVSRRHSNGDGAVAARPTEPCNDATAHACDELIYIVRGKSFLRYMVRKIVGTLLDVGKGKLAPSDIPALFDSRDRSRSGPTVPPEGLYLVSLEYPDPTSSLATRSERLRVRAPDSE